MMPPNPNRLSTEDQDDRILDAWWEERGFVVMSHRLERLHLTLDKLRELRFLATATRAALEAYTIDESGTFLRWPDLDVDLDWNGFLRLAGKTDPVRQRQIRSLTKGYGNAIRRLRELRELRQNDIKGLDERHVRRIEKGELPLTYSALTKLSQSHGMSMQEYLDKLAELDSPR